MVGRRLKLALLTILKPSNILYGYDSMIKPLVVIKSYFEKISKPGLPNEWN